MKKLLAFLLQFFLVSSLVLSEDVKQIIVPLEFYVGDSVQLRYSFDSSVDFFAIADPTSVKNDTLSLSPLQPAFVSPEMEYSVKEVSLQRYGSTYTIAIFRHLTSMIIAKTPLQCKKGHPPLSL